MKSLFLLFTLSFAVMAAHAEEVKKLRWGADIESGAPFSYKSTDNVDKIIGFEAEIVDALATELGMQAEFVQNSWDGLVEGLKRKDYDIIVNGLEITEERSKEVHFSKPYYYTAEVLAVRADEEKIHSLEDCRGRRVGTLGASLAERILREQPFAITILTNTEEVHLYSDLALGRTDAVFLDEPIALYYAKPNKELKLVGAPVGEMLYGIATRKSDTVFSAQIDQALTRLIANGKLRNILERWNLWNEKTAQAWSMSAEYNSKPVAFEDYVKFAWSEKTLGDRLKKYGSYLPLLGRGALMTLQVSLLSMILAMAMGLILALARLYGSSIVSGLALGYIELFRGTPLLIQLYLIFYGLPHLGLRLDSFTAAIIGLGLNYGACEAENYRAGVLSISRAQVDAAYALGMNWFQSLRHVILPQSMRIVLPPMTNDFIALLKDSSLVSAISMVELTTTYGQLASSSFDYLGIGLVTALIYFLIGLPFVRLSRYFEMRLNRSRRTVMD